MGMPAARVTDPHVCPMYDGPKPHVGGPVMPPCAPTVLTGNLPQARVTDLCSCAGSPDMIVRGSIGVLVGNLPAARLGDTTVHGGSIVAGCPTVLIGETGGGGVGPGGMAMVDAANGASSLGDHAAQAAALIAAHRDGAYFCRRCAADAR